MEQDLVKISRTEEALRKARAETELILSSITSILIGLDPNDRITHWNLAAEETFGITQENALGKPLESCGIQWNSPLVLDGVKECRKKGRPARVNDVRFMRLGVQEGFLGLTLIPVKGQPPGQLDVLIFGADITERKKLEQLKDEFISTVSHELRTPLAIVREGVSQVLDGILGETTEKQRNFLSVSLQAIDRLSRIINDLLDMSKIEAEKLELKRDLVDLTSLIQEITAPSSPFQMRVREKGLTLKANVPSDRLEVYADKDKLIQIFTNLVGNAMKFTEKGFIEISVLDRSGEVECHIRDTGMGIGGEDLPKVFSKFQQFGRTHGPGEKGTGLGLAISKGLVEMHRGKIWVESKLGEGTRFIFTIPKFTAQEVFREHISKALQKAVRAESTFSVIAFEVEGLQDLEGKAGAEHARSVVEGLQKSIQQGLRHKGDLAVRSMGRVLVVLPATAKEDASIAAQRMTQDCQEVLRRAGPGRSLALSFKAANFPEDGRTEDQLLSALRSLKCLKRKF